LPMSFILFALGEPAVVVLFGERWREGGEALTWMGAYTAGWAYISLAEHVAKSVGRPEVVLRLDLAACAATVVLIAALVQFGLIGVAIALSVSAAVTALYAFVWIVRLTETSPRRIAAEVTPPALAALVMAGVVYGLDRLLLDAGGRGTAAGLALLALEVLVGAIVYSLTLAALAPRTARELIDALSIRLRRAEPAAGR
jgi:O-antigen/teichoic acid export membrane protein